MTRHSWRHRRRSVSPFASRCSPLAVLLVTLAVACSDAPTAAKSPGKVLSPSRAALDVADDPGLNWSDTWISETQTFADTTVVSSSEPFFDPFAGQYVTSMTVGTDPEAVSVLAGYGYDGQVHVTTGFAASDYQETSLVRLVGNTPYDKSMYESLVPNVLDNEPLATLGDVAYSQIDPGGGGSTCITQSTPDCVYAMSANPDQAIGSSAQPRYVRLNASHVQAVMLSSGQSAAGAATVSPSSRETRDYEKRGSDWVLTHIKREIDGVGDRSTVHHIIHQHFTNISYKRNAKLDAERAKAARKGPPIAITPGVLAGECDPTANTELGCSGGGSGVTGLPTTGEPPAPDQSGIPGDEFQYDNGSGGPLLVFQHGFASSGGTWNRMAFWMKTDQATSNVFLPTTTWQNYYQDQMSQLRDELTTKYSGATSTIVIGHSNGGMIGRLLARDPGTTNVHGVVTVGTPHWGAPVATDAAGLARFLGLGATGTYLACAFIQGAGCAAAQSLVQTTGVYYVRYGSGVPVLDQMRYRSYYHALFNGDTEPVQRFGIVSESWSKWQAWRMLGDFKCYGDDPFCGGGVRVAKIDRTYHHDLACAVVGGFLGWFNSAAWGAARRCASDAAFLKVFDKLYYQHVGRGEGSDGLVPVSSQRYPLIPEINILRLQDGPSHVGETSHFRTRFTINSAIRQIVINNP